MFRDIKPADKERFLAMEQEFYSSAVVVHNIDGSCFLRTFEEAMKGNPYLRVLMIEVDNQIVGYALLSFTYSNEAGGMVVLVEEVQIDKPQRGKGIGTELLHFLEKEYPNAKRFRLEVTRNNLRAIELYEKLGYERLDYVQMIKDI
ncbi:MAG: GNAT family N-acetyltransferase [Prevotellaceae bacterium]|nr:GNAT family N-acetyltransferase [Prevotellaceae bacterium]